MGLSENKEAFLAWNKAEYEKSRRRLFVSLFSVLLFYVLVLFFGSLYLLGREIPVAYGLSVVGLLTFEKVLLGTIVIALVFYLVLLWLLILHFAFLWITIRKTVAPKVIKNKQGYNFDFILSLTVLFNWLLISKYFLAIEEFNRNYITQQQENPGVKARPKIKNTASVSINNLKAKQLIKDVKANELTAGGINIRNPNEWKNDSSVEMKSKYPEIISTSDLSSVLQGVKENENQLKSLKQSLDDFLARQEHEKGVAASNNVVNEQILNKTLELKELQQQEIAQVKKILELSENNRTTSIKRIQNNIASELEKLTSAVAAKKQWLKKMAALAKSLTLNGYNDMAKSAQPQPLQSSGVSNARVSGGASTIPRASAPGRPNPGATTSLRYVDYFLKIRSDQKQLQSYLEGLDWYELKKIANSLSIDASFKKRHSIIAEIVQKSVI